MKISIFSCACVLIYLASLTYGKKQDHHNNKLHYHAISRRSIVKQQQKKFDIPISSFVDDVSDSTAFRDREKKLKAIAQGELYAEHASSDVQASKRKDIKYPTREEQQEDNDASDDSNDVVDETKTTTGSKKHDILKEKSDTLDKNNDSEDEVDDESDDGDEESGSGENDDNSNTSTEKNNDDVDDSDESDESETTGDQRSGKLKCTKKCSVPISFHKCALPRCSLKMGTIKDLCFYLCKHQKEKCVDVCE